MRGCLFFQINLFFPQKSLKFGQNVNIIDMTPMLIIHSDPDAVLFLIEIALLFGVLFAAYVAVIVGVRAVKYMIIELYEGIKFTIEYWRDKEGRKNGMYKL